MPAVYRTERSVEWYDTDAARIAHFTAFFRWMEEAEHEFLRSLGLSVMYRDAEGEISWPRVAVSADYTSAVRYEDRIQIEIVVERLGDKSVSYQFQMSCQGRDVARLRLTTVCCRLDAEHRPRGISIPPDVAARFAPYLPAAASE